MKRFIFILTLTLICTSLFANHLGQSIARKKTQLYLYNSSEKALEEIKLLENQVVQSCVPESEKIAAKNILLIEKLNFSDVQSNSAVKRQFFTELSELSEVNKKLFTEIKNPDKWLLVTYSDLKVRLLEYLPPKDVYKESMETKKMYLQALKQDSKFSYAYNSYAMWLYFAPAIAGGGLDIAYKNFTKAIKYAENNEELYMYYINRSQILSAMKRYDKAKEDLEAAHNLFQEEKFTAAVRELNEKGKILFK